MSIVYPIVTNRVFETSVLYRNHCWDQIGAVTTVTCNNNRRLKPLTASIT